MALTRADIERRLDELAFSARPLYADPVPLEAFKTSAVDLFCKHYDKYGWPAEMPAFTLIPPEDGSPPLKGYAGYEIHGKSAIWTMPFGKMMVFEE